MVKQQVEAAKRLVDALEQLYPEKNWSKTPKFHNMFCHVPAVSVVSGAWERVNTQQFELANKLEKFVALNRTNSKDINHQIVQRALEEVAAQNLRWGDWNNGKYIDSLEEKKVEETGVPSGFEDSNSLQFPVHELFESKWKPDHVKLHV